MLGSKGGYVDEAFAGHGRVGTRRKAVLRPLCLLLKSINDKPGTGQRKSNSQRRGCWWLFVSLSRDCNLSRETRGIRLLFVVALNTCHDIAAFQTFLTENVLPEYHIRSAHEIVPSRSFCLILRLNAQLLQCIQRPFRGNNELINTVLPLFWSET